MPDKYGIVTYDELINDIRGDSPHEAEIAGWDDHQLKMDILKAEERICQLAKVEDEWVLYMKTGFSTFNIIENPYIIGATAASPIVIQTKTAHGLLAGDTIRIMRISGLLGANGQFQVQTVVDPTHFSIYNYDVLSGATNTNPIVIRDVGHQFNTGDTVTIAGVAGNTAANGVRVITVVDQDSYSIPVAGNGTYTGGGTATRISSGTGTYLAPSGQFYRTNEIPSYFRDFKVGKMLVNSFIQEMKYVDVPTIVDTEVRDNIFLLGQAATYIYPVKGVITRKDGHRYFRVYPVPVVDIYLTGYGIVQITPTVYANDNLGASVHLGPAWLEAIRKFVHYKAASRLKQPKEAAELYNEFRMLVADERRSRQFHPKQRVTYE